MRESNLRSAFSSGLKCVSLCLFRIGGPAEELESESDDAWLEDDGKTTEMGRPKPAGDPPEEPGCFPDIRSTLWAAPLPPPPAPPAAATTTMLLNPTAAVRTQGCCGYPCCGVRCPVPGESQLLNARLCACEPFLPSWWRLIGSRRL